MAFRQFTMFPRKAKKGKPVFYVRFRDPETDKRLTAMSSGKHSKQGAEMWAIEQVKKGLITNKSNMTFDQYAENWWVWDKCTYIAKKLAKSRIAHSYADSCRHHLVTHILPVFGNLKLYKITRGHIENFQMSLIKAREGKKALSRKTANNIVNTLKVMISEAFRLGYLPTNPASTIGKLKDSPREKGILTRNEIKQLFSDAFLEQAWGGKKDQRCVNELALSTGSRIGEIQALRRKDIQPGYISIDFAWGRKYGLGEPKWGSARKVPICQSVYSRLSDVMKESIFKQPDDFVFTGKEHNKPVDNKTITEILYKALDAIGVLESERRARNITFHSWRHAFNTYMRGKVADSKLRRMTGHKTAAMTERYTNFNLEDFDEVAQFQEEMFG